MGSAPQLDVSVSRACLVILDGWGIARAGPGNAIALARTPIFDGLWRRCPHARLSASGRDVGLPAGQMGNSEVGHLTLGAGAPVPQALALIEDAIADGELKHNDVLRGALTGASRVHLIGLASDGGVHAQLAHARALIELAAELQVEDLVIHCITDGRDTGPETGVGFLGELERCCRERGSGRVGSVVGRFYAMDRDGRWERTQAAYDLLVHARAGHHADTAVAAARDAYGRGETDEFIAPTLVGREGAIGHEDSVVCLNFRPDRMRQLVGALADPALGDPEAARPGWEGRGGAPPVRRLATMTSYQEGWPYPAAFAPGRPRDTLAAAISRTGASQLHVAETEKYAHVTYFFNGGVEQPLTGERRELVPSRRDVPTYDLAPEMRAREITQRFLDAFEEDLPMLSVVNFANADMVGHSGSIPATIRAVETIDRCLLTLIDRVEARGGVCLITADHGNAEQMLSHDGGPQTAHTTNPVPLILAGAAAPMRGRGTLADVAPTIMDLLGLDPPAAMTGRTLLRGGGEPRAARENTTSTVAGS